MQLTVFKHFMYKLSMVYPWKWSVPVSLSVLIRHVNSYFLFLEWRTCFHNFLYVYIILYIYFLTINSVQNIQGRFKLVFKALEIHLSIRHIADFGPRLLKILQCQEKKLELFLALQNFHRPKSKISQLTNWQKFRLNLAYKWCSGGC